MADFQAPDFLQLDDLLAEEEKLARDTVRDFVGKEFLPVIQEHVRQDGSFPKPVVTVSGDTTDSGRHYA